MQLSRLCSTALVLLLVACGDDSGGGDGETTNDASVTEAPKSDGGLDSGNAAAADTGVTIRNDSSVADSGTKPATDSGTPTPTDAGGTVADTGTPSTPPDAGGTTPDAGQPATGESFAALYASIFMPKCATPTCHGSGTHRSGLFLSTVGAGYTSLLKAAGADESGAGSACKDQPKKRVTPGSPQQSLLVDMIGPPPHCGIQMPPNGPYLSAAEQKRISDWIAQGAKNN